MTTAPIAAHAATILPPGDPRLSGHVRNPQPRVHGLIRKAKDTPT